MKKKIILTAGLTVLMLGAVCAYPVHEIALRTVFPAAADAAQNGWLFYQRDDEDTYRIYLKGTSIPENLYIPAELTFDTAGAKASGLPETAGTYKMRFYGFLLPKIETDPSRKAGIPDNLDVYTLIEDTSCLEKLRTVTVEDGAVLTDNSVFKDCINLTDVRLPADLKKLPGGCFAGCTNLTCLDIPETVTSIGNGAFADCTGLESLTIPESITEISNRAFAGCTALNKITIPEGITKIGDYAFSGCTALNKFTIPEGVRTIAQGAFSTSGIEEIVLPEHVEAIEGFAFGGCENLKSVTIENPACSIDNNNHVLYSICDDSGYHYDGIIYGLAGSTAEAYAKENGCQFSAIGGSPASTEETGQTATEEVSQDKNENGLPYAPAGSRFGDVNGDGIITADDARGVLQYYVQTLAGDTPSWREITGNPDAPS